MINKEYRAVISDLIYLVSCAINGLVPKRTIIDEMDLKQLHRAADWHLLTGITAIALESAGIRDGVFAQSKGKAIRKELLFDRERAVILNKMEEAAIWYMPLKGVILKDLYPMVGMRQMADNDILHDETRAEDVQTIMKSLGYTFDHSSAVHSVYLKPPVFNFEMHGRLFHGKTWKQFVDYYSDVKNKLIRDEGRVYGFHFSEEDFYIYMIAHEFKHYLGKGTGLRSLLDCYVYWMMLGDRLNWSYIEEELNKLEISDFEKKNRRLSQYLFGRAFAEAYGSDAAEQIPVEETLSLEDQELLNDMLSSGTYGTIQNRVEKKVKYYGGGTVGKLRFVLSRVFIPLDSIRATRPIFLKIPILLPFLPLYRAFLGLTVKRNILKEEINALKKK